MSKLEILKEKNRLEKKLIELVNMSKIKNIDFEQMVSIKKQIILLEV